MRKLFIVCAVAIAAAGMIAAPASATFFTTSTLFAKADCEGYELDVQAYSGSDENLRVMWEVKLFDTSDALITSANGESAIPYVSGSPLQTFDFDGSWGMELCGTYYATAYVKIVDSSGNIWTNYWNGGSNYLILPNPAKQEFTFESDAFDCICDTGGCTRTQGYWKTHPEAWPTDTIGCIGLSKAEALDLLNTPARGDKWLIMVHQYIAAYLNVESGAGNSCIADDLSAACAWLNEKAGSRPVRPWGGMEDVKNALDDYNNGRLGCADHCDNDCCKPEPKPEPQQKPKKLKLAKKPKMRNFPNPFNPVTTLEFTLPEAGFARVEIYNMLGERIDTLAERSFQAGTYTVEWNASRYASGTYFYRLTTANHSVVQKILFVK